MAERHSAERKSNDGGESRGRAGQNCFMRRRHQAGARSSSAASFGAETPAEDTWMAFAARTLIEILSMAGWRRREWRRREAADA